MLGPMLDVEPLIFLITSHQQCGFNDWWAKDNVKAGRTCC